MLFRKNRNTKEEEYRKVELGSPGVVQEKSGQEPGPGGTVREKAGKEADPAGTVRERAGKEADPAGTVRERAGKEDGPAGTVRERTGQETAPTAAVREKTGKEAGPAGTVQEKIEKKEAPAGAAREKIEQEAAPQRPVRREAARPTPHQESITGQAKRNIPDPSPDDGEEKEAGQESKGLLWLRRILLAVLLIAASLLLTFGYSLWKEYSADESREGKEIVVEIPKGSSTRKVAAILKDSGVVRYETPFLLKMRSSQYRGKLRYGTFTLNDGMCLDDIISRLMTNGDVKDKSTLMIPEGYSVEMIAAKLEREDIMTAGEFLSAVTKAAQGSDYAGQFPDKNQVFYQLQGYLFPDTYPVTEDMTGDDLVEMMLDEFSKKFDSERIQQAKEAGMTMEEVLIRASLVQKETEVADEYAMIAGVINNRLSQNMKIQFDSTVIYPMSKGMFGVAHLTYDDLKLQSPYNTYYVKGLPVGPICNPGLEAIDAVLSPKEHNYLYFQTDRVKDDGTSLFFETYEEHAAAQATTEREAPATEEGSSSATSTESSEAQQASSTSENSNN